MKRFLFPLATGLLLAACGGGGDTGGGDPSPTEPPSGGIALQRVSNTACLAPEDTMVAGELSLTPAFPNMPAIGGLMGMFQAPGDNSAWYALQREGRVLRFANSPNAAQFDVFFNISREVRERGEMGLLGFAFHPQFADNGQFFIYYSDDGNDGASTISRFTYDGSNIPVSVTTEEVILTLSQPASNHNGGAIHFGPDGMLYIGFGDGGGGNDPYGNGQNPMTWHGSLLRIDVDSASPYAVPADNPYANNPEFLPEIYAYGLRNPWRWTFDQENGALWLADVGQGAWEEVNIVSAGDNLGWPIMEGSACLDGGNCDTSGLVLPVAEYPHANGDCSVSGGYVYRGDDIPALDGNYFYADFCTGRIRRTFPAPNNSWQTEEVLVSGRNIAAFAQDNAGEVYVLDSGGGPGDGIFKLTADSSSSEPGLPAENLADTGCFSSVVDKTVAAGVVPYETASTLWSDGAEKERFFAVPDNTQIGLLSDGDFDFPVGSVLIKHFLDGDQYLETRLFAHQSSGWRGYSYEWNDAGTEAVLLDEGKTITRNGFTHIIPSRDECLVCHTSAANFSLGLEAGQLNSDLLYPSGEVDNQLAALVEASYLASAPSDAQTPELAGIADTEASVERRARSYLHSNCSGCHRPNASGSLIDLRIQTSLANTGACDEMPASGDLGINNARIIAPGDPARSVLLARMQDLGENRMPPLATQRLDDAAIALIEQWINELQACSG